MYLDEIYLENTGPISKCHVQMPFAENGNPRPVVIVGPNGSGKSIFLSYIVDALYEFAIRVFHDIVPSQGLRQPYYRVISERGIKSGSSHSLSLLRFKAAENDLLYCEKVGDLDLNASHLTVLKSQFHSLWHWPPKENYKEVSRYEEDKEIARNEFQSGAHVFFPASRRECPDWLNPQSVGLDSVVALDPIAAALNLSIDALGKPIYVATCGEDTISWVQDVYFDSLQNREDDQDSPDAKFTSEKQVERANRRFFRFARRSVESILRVILQDCAAELKLNFRNRPQTRIGIRMSNGQVVPSLRALSEAQIQLFNLFSTIIRYGEQDDIRRSLQHDSIEGIVLIDEIDVHLHPSLQYEVVPKLIKLFPKVQFIMSSHSPLFLLGMEREFGQDGLRIIELPSGTRISSERYTEFGNAFQYYQETDAFQEEIEKRFKERSKPLVLTEGESDVRYLKTALTLLDKAQLLNYFDFDSVGGKEGLNRFRTMYEAKPSLIPLPVLLLYDRDAKKTTKVREGPLWIYSIPHNPENKKVCKGIENLFPEILFENRFYQKRPLKNGYGGNFDEFDKPAFCNWICDERKDSADFEKFDSVIEILEEFSAAHQPNKADT